MFIPPFEYKLCPFLNLFEVCIKIACEFPAADNYCFHNDNYLTVVKCEGKGMKKGSVSGKAPYFDKVLCFFIRIFNR